MPNVTISTDARPRLVTTAIELRDAVAAARADGKTIGLAPTMGALHGGHLSLVRASLAQCDYTIVTIFVNPTQFGPHEDLGEYPRTLETDLDALSQCGVDLVFAPTNDGIYPKGFSTYVDPPRVAEALEGQCRRGHFRGVTTVVLKLFNLAQADVAFFGQKDYQQSLVIRWMVQDLDFPIEVRVCPTVREPDGLAMSSRNRYLSQPEREQALTLWRSLKLAVELFAQGESDAERITARMRELFEQTNINRVDYVALADPETLQPVHQIQASTVALVAAYVGDTRLIDNCRIGNDE
ncbi:MAG: pantoate--beta-alanine ligase [Pirellulaceae bacterium]|nr:pantoate--beta-alanine ligase [Pirellulaceae bacterium]